MKNESNVNSYAKSFPATFESAIGEFLMDSHGKQYLDFFCGAGALNYGHNNPEIKNELLSFLEKNAVVHCLDMDTTTKANFLDKFNSIILEPRGLDYKIQFTGPTGTNAVEAAIKLARIATKRKKIIAFTHSFHGMSASSLALSGSLEKSHNVNPAQDVIFFPFDNFLGSSVNTVDLLDKMILTDGSGIELPAAIILETIQAEGGVNIASDEWLRDLRAFTSKNEIILIVDDIQVGCGRAGKFFSFEHAGIQPDIILLSKSISGYGLPLSLVLIKPEFDIWKPGEHNGTFRANNLSLCTASKALDFWQDGLLEETMASNAKIIENSLSELLALSEQVIAVRGVGMIWGVEFAEASVAQEIVKSLFQKGMLIERCGNYGQVLKLLPALTISEPNLKKGLELIANEVLSLTTSLIAS